MSVVEECISFPSSTSGLDLHADIAYDDARTNLPLMVLLGSYMGDGEPLRPEWLHMAEAGLFAIAPEMRGRGRSPGQRDSGGVEIMDIHDAVRAALRLRADRIDPNNLNVWGRSGGGGNVFSCLSRFPDLFRCAVVQYGISDYGYDRRLGWYYNGAVPRHRARMELDIGLPQQASDRYMARSSLLGVRNNAVTCTHLFVDAEEKTCPVNMHTEYLARSSACGFTNVRLYVSGPGSPVRWTHDHHQYALADLESHYLADVLEGRLPVPELPRAGSMTVLGYLVTRDFGVWLGDGQNAVADLDYDLSDAEKHFVFRLRTSDSSVQGRLAIPGSRPQSVLMNRQGTYWEYNGEETIIEIDPNRSYTWLA
jgi:pimeloyl-ACP methyl ester carboxylesterase